MKKPTQYILLLCLSYLAGSCSVETDLKNDAASPEGNELHVSDLKDTGCKEGASRSTADETVFLKALGNNRLQVRHSDVYYNCSATIVVEAARSKNRIYILEKETNIVGSCICLYNFSYIIEAPHGTFDLYVNNRYAGEFTFDLQTDTALKIYKQVSYHKGRPFPDGLCHFSLN